MSRTLGLAIAAVTASAVVAPGCGGGPHPRASRAAPPAVAHDFAAARWLPARPTYAITARSVRAAHTAVADAINSIGVLGGIEQDEVSAKLRRMFVIDPLSPHDLANIGVDLDGGVAVFSDALDPTLVVHLASPEQLRAFLEDQRARNHVTSQLAGEVEVFGVRVDRHLGISWAIDGDWLWVHLALGDDDDGIAWFVASHTPAAPRWTAAWQAARGGAPSPAVIGFADLHALLGKLPGADDALACVELLTPIRGLGFAVALDDARVALRLALDVGPAAATLGRAVLPRPAGWSGAAAGAVVAAEWNLDLQAVARQVSPCTRALGHGDLTALEDSGVRAGRGFVHTVDLDAKSGQGAVSLDLASNRRLAGMLDDIPMRSHLESSRRFGPYAGKHLAIPFGPELDYVLTDRVALAGIGDGLLARVVGDGGTSPGPLLALDVRPAALPTATWQALLELAGISHAARIAERIAAWRAGHLAVRIDGRQLVLEASGERR